MTATMTSVSTFAWMKWVSVDLFTVPLMPVHPTVWCRVLGVIVCILTAGSVRLWGRKCKQKTQTENANRKRKQKTQTHVFSQTGNANRTHANRKYQEQAKQRIDHTKNRSNRESNPSDSARRCVEKWFPVQTHVTLNARVCACVRVCVCACVSV